jgi:transcriptional regulator with XRE-family HTH domain
MDDLRAGRAVRLLRQRAGLTQLGLAERAHVSRSVVSRFERGLLTGLTVSSMRALADALGVRLEVQLRWNGGEMDRLLDAAHARLVEACVRLLRSVGWVVVPEASFSIFGERGSVDVLAWHPAHRAVLVVEVKSRIMDVQDLLVALDRKRRLAPRIAADRGWDAASVGVWLAIGDGRTNRRRLSEHRQTFAAAFDGDGRGLRGWLREPRRAASFVAFLPFAPGVRTRPSRRGR